MSRHSEPEVLVVGAGPVGLVATLFLSQHGVRGDVIDMHQRTHQHSYALAIHPRTLGILEEAGLSERLIAAGRKVTTVAFYDGGNRRAEIDYSALDSRHPYLLVLRQSLLEHAVEEALLQRSVRVRWCHRLQSLEAHGTSVQAEVATLDRFDPGFATDPNAPDGSDEFWPYLRDEETLARPWAVPGTPGLEHRIGGLEKADGHGAISYDPDNHERMVRLRQAKIDGIPVPDLAVDDPTEDAELLVLGWGSTYGPIGAGARRVRAMGHRVATAHLRHLNPMPANLGEVLARYRTVLVPEMNLGQLALLLRARHLVDVHSYTKVSGLPFKAEELQNLYLEYLTEATVG